MIIACDLWRLWRPRGTARGCPWCLSLSITFFHSAGRALGLEEESQHCRYQQLRLCYLWVWGFVPELKGRDSQFCAHEIISSNSEQGPLQWPALSRLNQDSWVWGQGLRVRVHGASLTPSSCCPPLGPDSKAAGGGISCTFVVPELPHHSQSRACFSHKQGLYYASL